MDRVLILDFGSQYTQLIARRVRELKVYSEIHPYSMPAAEIRAFQPAALILSGSPASIYQADAPKPDPDILALGLPILGICYGHQLLAWVFAVPAQHNLFLGHEGIQQARAVLLQPVEDGTFTLTVKAHGTFHFFHVIQGGGLRCQGLGQPAVDLGAGVKLGQRRQYS